MGVLWGLADGGGLPLAATVRGACCWLAYWDAVTGSVFRSRCAWPGGWLHCVHRRWRSPQCQQILQRRVRAGGASVHLAGGAAVEPRHNLVPSVRRGLGRSPVAECACCLGVARLLRPLPSGARVCKPACLIAGGWSSLLRLRVAFADVSEAPVVCVCPCRDGLPVRTRRWRSSAAKCTSSVATMTP